MVELKSSTGGSMCVVQRASTVDGVAGQSQPHRSGMYPNLVGDPCSDHGFPQWAIDLSEMCFGRVPPSPVRCIAASLYRHCLALGLVVGNWRGDEVF